VSSLTKLVGVSLKSTILSLTDMNRSELQDAYINTVIDNMDHKDMWALLFDFMDSDLDRYSEAQLIEEVEQYYPELLEG
jgi:hypothetical protein